MTHKCSNCNRFVSQTGKCSDEGCEHAHYNCSECGELTEDEVEEV